MPIPVYSPSEASAGIVVNQIVDITTTRQTVLLPTGAKWVAITYQVLPGSVQVVGQLLRVAINAASNDHADGLLTLSDGHVPIFQNETVQIPADAASPITRIDLKAAAAVGAEKTVVRILSGV